MGKRSGIPETDEAIAGLTEDQLVNEIWASKQRLPSLGVLPHKNMLKRIHRLEKALAARRAS